MNLRSRVLPRALVGVAVLAAGPLLAGCSGVVKNLNSAQVNVPNVAMSPTRLGWTSRPLRSRSLSPRGMSWPLRLRSSRATAIPMSTRSPFPTRAPSRPVRRQKRAGLV